MHRFYTPSQNISGNKIIIQDKQEIHHIRDVLRLKLNDRVIAFDDRGNEYNCLIEKWLPEVTLTIKDKIVKTKGKKTVSLTLACAIPKQERMDEIMDKLTQLGVERIIPLQTQRVIVKLEEKKRQIRLERWKKIAVASSQQSQRREIPIIEPVSNLKTVLSELDQYDLKLIPALFGERKTLKQVLNKCRPKNILVLIGPEGDFTPEELDLAKKAGCLPITLGDLVLRVDTAAIAVASFVKLYANY